jgi:predicted nucleic acid-binding Zn ribbon protein
MAQKSIFSVWVEKYGEEEAQRRLTYEADLRFCKECKQPIPYERRKNKFCNSTCSAIYNNTHRVEDSQRIGVCLFCGTIFSKKPWSNQKFCNQRCSTLYSKNQLKKSWLETGKAGNWTGGKSDGAPRCHYILETLQEEQNNTCDICHLVNEWEDKPLIFILDHKDGNSTNNSRDNLRLICPNCNSQTPTFSGRNKGKGRKTKGFVL